jgi:ribosomal protein S18 acetylase RimI-like enzyme
LVYKNLNVLKIILSSLHAKKSTKAFRIKINTKMIEQVIIRKATDNDLTALLAFEQGVIAAERPFDPTLREGHINYYDIAKMISSDTVELVVAEYENNIIASGYARIENARPFLQYTQYAYLGFMYVHPAFRGKGINAMIIDALKKTVLAWGIHEMRLEVYVDNGPAISAYEKIGFTKLLTEMRMPVE